MHARATPSDATLLHARRGILINLVAKLDGTKAVIGASFECKKHFDRLVEIDPESAFARHFVGMWDFEAASVGWLARKAQPRTLPGGAPTHGGAY